MYQAHLKEAYFNRKHFANRKRAGTQLTQGADSKMIESGSVKITGIDLSKTVKDRDFFEHETTAASTDKRLPQIHGKKGTQIDLG